MGLLHCPFCGVPAPTLKEFGGGFYIECRDCPAVMEDDSREAVVTAWNARAASVWRSGNRQDRETGLASETPTPGPTIDQDGGEADIDRELEAILAKDDTEVMLDELRELFGADLDVDSRFTVAQVMTAMESSFKRGKEWIEMVHRAEKAAKAPPAQPENDQCQD